MTRRMAIVTWNDGTKTAIYCRQFKKIDSESYRVQFDDYSWETMEIVTDMRWNEN